MGGGTHNMKKATTFIFIILVITCCCLSLIKAEVIAYMWQENDLNPKLFGCIQDENNPHRFSVNFEQHNYRDTVRICVIKLTGDNPADLDYFEIVYTSPVLDPGPQNTFPLTLAYTDGIYRIQFESVSLKANGNVDENRPIYILHEIDIDGRTLSVLPAKSYTVCF